MEFRRDGKLVKPPSVCGGEPTESNPLVAQLEALGVIEAPVVSAAVPAMQLRAEGRLARFLPQWRIRG